MFDQVKHAVLPPMGLAKTMKKWGELANALADTSRQRPSQRHQLENWLDPRP